MYHTKKPEEVFEILKSSPLGLTREQTQKRLKEYGENKLPETKTDGILVIFFRQFQSPLIYILLAACLIVLTLGEIIDGLIILAVLIFNAVVGTIQEGKAQNTLNALKKFTETSATVLRDSKEIIIPDFELVPGDVIILQEGEKVPADCRLILVHNLKVDQAALTGESEPVFKIDQELNDQNLAVADQKNMAFKGTYIVAGNAEAIVTATGLETVIGKISQQIAALETEIPLKKNIRALSRLILAVVFVLGAILFFAGISSGRSIAEMFSIVVALLVSIIPEGLPIVVTLILATGVWRMAKRNALVKRLQAVEALGQAKIIAVDKTGTITKNELMIEKVYSRGKFFEIAGIGYEPKGEIYALDEKEEKKLIAPPEAKEFILAGKIAAFCSNARVYFSEEEKRYKISGDPTEAALFVLGEKTGFQREIVDKEHPLIKEIPFDYRIKYHVTFRETDEKNGFLTMVGAPEEILNFSDINKKQKQEFEAIFHKMSSTGLRVLGFAFKILPKNFDLDNDLLPLLEFGGFYGMKDSLKTEVKEVLKKAKEIGIKVVMITGDHKLTAEAIAKEAGIFKTGDEVLTGKEIQELSEEELTKKLEKVSVFARVTPEDKLKIISAYQKKGEIVAMTGDGVNDAPSLVAADLGVAMGKIGTEVAKEASDIILLDDNFGTIVSAIEEGRNIYKTIKKVILYLFSTSLGEVLTITGALFIGYPLPLLAGQIIWLNFVTDGFLTVALGMEPKEKNLLREKWRKPNKFLIDSSMVARMLIMGPIMALGALFVFRGYFVEDLAKGMTMALTTLAVFQWFNAWNCRSDKKSIFKDNIFSNKWLFSATVIVIILQNLAIYNPWLQKVLRTVPLDFSDWLIAIGIALFIIIVEEIRKFFYNIIKLTNN